MFNIKKIRKDIALIKERKNMSELVIKTAKENGALPEDFDDGDNEMNWEKQSFNPSLFNIFNPLKMKEALDKANGRIITPKDKE